jgi:hypothetical protein
MLKKLKKWLRHEAAAEPAKEPLPWSDEGKKRAVKRAREAWEKRQASFKPEPTKVVETTRMTPEERRERERRKLFARLGGRN